MSIKDNLRSIEDAIAEACRRAGRHRASVRLVAVTKNRSPAEIIEAIEHGVTDVGENRVQEAAAKRPLVGPGCRWHLVGNLQTNKVRRALELFDFIQSVDSIRLAEEIARRLSGTGRRVPCCIEVNTSGEVSKHGVTPEGLPELVEAVLAREAIELVGLMTIGPGLAVENPELSRPCFVRLRQLAEECRQRFGIALPELSMGMSADFAVGIEEGATMVRIGTAIFGPRPDR